MNSRVNILALLVCPVANMLLGMGWYGVFSGPWMEGHHLTMEVIQANASSLPYMYSVLGSLLSAYILSLLFNRMGVNTWADGAKTGAMIGFFGLSGTIISSSFAQLSFLTGLIDGGFALLLFIVYGAIIGGWQKKA